MGCVSVHVHLTAEQVSVVDEIKQICEKQDFIDGSSGVLVVLAYVTDILGSLAKRQFMSSVDFQSGRECMQKCCIFCQVQLSLE